MIERSLLDLSWSCAAVLALAACGAGAPATPPLADLVELESPAAPGSGEPNLAIGPDGRVYLSWLEPEGAEGTAAASTRAGAFALRLAVLQDGAWSEPVTIARGDDFFVNWADFPSLALLADGSLAAHWLVRSGEGRYAYDVHIARSTDGGATWSEPVVPHRDGTASEHGFVSLFPWADGRLAAVWLDGRKYAAAGAAGGHEGHGSPEAEMTLRMTTIAADGALGPELLLDERSCDCCQTAAAVTAEGPVVAYRDRSEAEIRDIYVTRYAGGAWSEPRVVHEDGWEIAACPVNGPAISADGRRVAVAWFTAAQDTPRVRIAFSDDAGATFGAPLRVDGGTPTGRVDVELLAGGDALVSWLERVGEGAELRVRRVRPDGPTGPVMAVAGASAERSSGFPRMARVGRDVVFAWTRPGDPARVQLVTAKLMGAE